MRNEGKERIACQMLVQIIIKYSVICTIVLAYLTYICSIFSGRRSNKKPKNVAKMSKLLPSYELQTKKKNNKKTVSGESKSKSYTK